VTDFFLQTAFVLVLVYLAGVYPAFAYFQIRRRNLDGLNGALEDFRAAWKWPVCVLDWVHDRSR
jgi:hypothetical protein